MEHTNVSLETYARLCARMADTGGDLEREYAIAGAEGVARTDWTAAKDYYTAKMQDPSDMGRTAMAFMPLFQAAQAEMRGGGEPGSLEMFAKVHAEMTHRKDPSDPSKKLDHMVVIAENGFTHARWLEMESFWTPRVGSDEFPEFDPELAAKFRELLQRETDRVLGIER
ncbi:MAG: hypothetical protein AVO35_08940 [Candidatus Aegiribacteria sp. MLS_C]|nr:MAG: hypothetical protein AVO35_08940 [Candidatus Aegiribacteria sp. MLS_C]